MSFPVTTSRRIAVGVLRVLLAFTFLSAGIAKLVGLPQMVEGFALIGFGQWFRIFTGMIELVGAVLLITHRLVGVGALLLACTMIGATVAHLTRAPGSPLPALVLLALTGFVAFTYRHRMPGIGAATERTARSIG